MKVYVYKYPNSRRSDAIAEAMATGIRLYGDEVRVKHGSTYERPDGDAAVFYGLMSPIMEGYKAAGKPFVYVDLGYWGRHDGGRRHGYHKIAVNSRHPTSYFQKIKKPIDRFDHFHLDVNPWQDPPEVDGYIMLAGMSEKAAKAEGFRAEEWERLAVGKIRRHTKRRIVYRPKPNWNEFKAIPGTETVRGSDVPGDVCRFLSDCWAVVTHHSNVAVDALLYGVPVFVEDGVALPLSLSDLTFIERPRRWVTGREQWAADLAYTQWNVAEMIEGRPWQMLREDKII